MWNCVLIDLKRFMCILYSRLIVDKIVTSLHILRLWNLGGTHLNTTRCQLFTWSSSKVGSLISSGKGIRRLAQSRSYENCDTKSIATHCLKYMCFTRAVEPSIRNLLHAPKAREMNIRCLVWVIIYGAMKVSTSMFSAKIGVAYLLNFPSQELLIEYTTVTRLLVVCDTVTSQKGHHHPAFTRE